MLQSSVVGWPVIRLRSNPDVLLPVDLSLPLFPQLRLLGEEDRRLQPLRAQSLDEAIHLDGLACVAGLDAEERPRDRAGETDQPRFMPKDQDGCEEY